MKAYMQQRLELCWTFLGDTRLLTQVSKPENPGQVHTRVHSVSENVQDAFGTVPTSVSFSFADTSESKYCAFTLALRVLHWTCAESQTASCIGQWRRRACTGWCTQRNRTAFAFCSYAILKLAIVSAAPHENKWSFARASVDRSLYYCDEHIFLI